MRHWIRLLCLAVAVAAQAAEQKPIYEREMPTDPAEQKKYFEELERALKGVAEATKAETAKATAAVARESAVSRPRPVEVAIPPRDDARIRLASRRTVSAQSLPGELAEVRRRLRAGLDRDSLAEVDAALRTFGAKPGALAALAAIAWVQEAPGTALLLAAEAAHREPGNANALNTLGALLSDAGYVERGIPLLAYLAQKYPDDPTLENNLGQAWLGVGAPELAKPRLLACLRRAPAHGAAHAAMGVIAHAEGDAAESTRHFEAAAASNSSAVARRALDRLGRPHRMPRSFHRVSPVRDFFNPREFVLPNGQQSLAEAELKRAQQIAFGRLIGARLKLAELALTTAAENLAREAPLRASLAFSQSVGAGSHLNALDLKGLNAALDELPRRTAEFRRDVDAFKAEADTLWANARTRVEELRRAFIASWQGGRDIGEGGGLTKEFEAATKQFCLDSRKIMEGTLPPIAKLYDDLVIRVTTRERVATNEALTYLPLSWTGDALHQQFYSVVISHLRNLGELAGSMPVHTFECGPPLLPVDYGDVAGSMPSPGPCPINLNLKLGGVVKVKLDCKSVGLAVEAGLKFSAKKSFQSGETTLTGGLGADLDLHDLGQVEAGGEFVVVWDRGNSLSFVGVQASAGATLAGIPGLSRSAAVEPGIEAGAETPGLTPEVVNVSTGTRLGVTLGPRGVEPSLNGKAGVEVLGQDLVKAEL